MQYPLLLNYGLYGKVKQGFQPEIKPEQTIARVKIFELLFTFFREISIYESSCPVIINRGARRFFFLQAHYKFLLGPCVPLRRLSHI
jgi:hypothetical protein